MRPLVITRTRTIDHEALIGDPVADETPLVIRGAPRLERALPILRAIAAGRAIAPIDEDAPAGAEDAHRARLATLATDRPPLAYLATSGSTGTPTIAELGADAWRAHAVAATEHLQLRPDDRWLCTLPLSHTGGLSILVRCRHAGAAVVLDDPPHLGPTWVPWLASVIGDLGVTRLSLVPAQLDLVVRADLPAPRSVRSVLLGGQALDDGLAARALALGWPLVASYGLTETCGMCVATRIGETPRGAGRPLPGTQLRLAELDAGVGLLEIASTALARRLHGTDRIAGGWLRTFDRARLDDGALSVLGRADDVVISGGHKIDPSIVETALRRSPLVADAAAAGVADPAFGSSLAALVVLHAGCDHESARLALDDELTTLPRHARPRHLRFTDELPRLPSGKLDRLAVRRALGA